MQHFITRVGVEGVMTAVMTAISKSLLATGFDLAGSLSLFVRDEVGSPVTDCSGYGPSSLTVQLLTWHNTYMKDSKSDSLHKSVQANVDMFVRRVTTLGYIGENQDKVSQQVRMLLSYGRSGSWLAANAQRSAGLTRRRHSHLPSHISQLSGANVRALHGVVLNGATARKEDHQHSMLSHEKASCQVSCAANCR